LVDGDISQIGTATKIIEMAATKFRSVAAFVNDAGIFGDYQYPYCGEANMIVDEIRRRLGDDLCFVL
jgi:hypothetical protein